MIGVRNMMVVFEVCDSRSSGTEAERKRISSVTGPWFEILEVLLLPKQVNNNILQQSYATQSSC